MWYNEQLIPGHSRSLNAVQEMDNTLQVPWKQRWMHALQISFLRISSTIFRLNLKSILPWSSISKKLMLYYRAERMDGFLIRHMPIIWLVISHVKTEYKCPYVWKAVAATCLIADWINRSQVAISIMQRKRQALKWWFHIAAHVTPTLGRIFTWPIYVIEPS